MPQHEFMRMREEEITVGGLSGLELLARLEESDIQLNEIARKILKGQNFKFCVSTYRVKVTIQSLNELGLPNGGTLGEAIDAAAALGYRLCPLELGPHLRLAYLNQEEGSVGFEPSKHQAPPQSITVVDQRPDKDQSEYQGFYLRRIDGKLWLRGYTSWSGHVWQPSDMLAFTVPHNAT
ncbi:helicase [Pseudaquabacterium pictum]|nr:helicase [Rubrivivax pictus]